MFIFLFGGVNFLLLLFLATIEVGSGVHVGTFAEELGEVDLVKMAALTDKTSFGDVAFLNKLLKG
jgi:phage-related holin